MEEKRKLVLLGGGGHCKSILDAAERTGLFDEIVIIDHELKSGTKIWGHTVVGDDSQLNRLFNDGYKDAFISVGSIQSTKVRHLLLEKAKAIGFIFPNIIDTSAIVSDHVMLGIGIFIGKGAVINADAVINDMSIINTGAIIEHECRISDFSHVAVGVRLCGNVVIGSDTFIGAGTTVIQGVSIGDEVIIGAGSLVLSDVKSQCLKKGIIK